MLARLGFVASVLTEGITTSRTCRLRNADSCRLRALTARNLDALGRVLSFLEKRRIYLYRISSNLIPFASHPINTSRWWDDHASRLDELGNGMRRLGLRVSTHPGQYTVLNSPHEAIVRSSVVELRYHARLLDALGTDTSCKIVVHVGGLYGGTKSDAVRRFVANATALPSAVRRRLVVENDDRLFDADDALSAGRAASIPVVFDWLHHCSNPCRRPTSEVLRDVFGTWTPRDGLPKVHLSSQAKSAPAGAHADFVSAADAIAFLNVAPDAPFDCMLEAKQKDRALLRLRAELKRRGIVEAELADASAQPRARTRASALQQRARSG